MTQDEFILLVRKYRETQLMYQRTKHYVYAHELKSLEKEIDSAIAKHMADELKRINKMLDFPDF